MGATSLSTPALNPTATQLVGTSAPTDHATCEVTVESASYRSNEALETEQRLKEKGRF
jgi:hypothetical protein